MEVLTSARLGLASSCIGAAKRLLKLAVDRSCERKTFGRNISEFGLIRDKIAEMTAETFALESMTYLTTGLVDAGRSDFTVESAICKVFGSETLWRVANDSAQIAGALGYTRAHPWERLLRDARMPMVFEGTNEILRCFIALSGMQGASRDIEEVSLAKVDARADQGVRPAERLRAPQARSALGRERMSKSHAVLAREAVIFEEYTGHLAKSVGQVLRRHGKNIAEMQYSQKRAADVAIDLYAIAAVLSRTTRAIERRGEEGSRREIDLASVFVSSAKRASRTTSPRSTTTTTSFARRSRTKTCADGGYPLDVV